VGDVGEGGYRYIVKRPGGEVSRQTSSKAAGDPAAGRIPGGRPVRPQVLAAVHVL